MVPPRPGRALAELRWQDPEECRADAEATLDFPPAGECLPALERRKIVHFLYPPIHRREVDPEALDLETSIARVVRLNYQPVSGDLLQLDYVTCIGDRKRESHDTVAACRGVDPDLLISASTRPASLLVGRLIGVDIVDVTTSWICGVIDVQGGTIYLIGCDVLAYGQYVL